MALTVQFSFAVSNNLTHHEFCTTACKLLSRAIGKSSNMISFESLLSAAEQEKLE